MSWICFQEPAPKTWFASRFGDYFLNSALVVSLSVLALLIVCVPAAYVLSRSRFRGRQAVSNFMVFGMGVPILGSVGRYSSEELAALHLVQQYDMNIPLVSATL